MKFKSIGDTVKLNTEGLHKAVSTGNRLFTQPISATDAVTLFIFAKNKTTGKIIEVVDGQFLVLFPNGVSMRIMDCALDLV